MENPDSRTEIAGSVPDEEVKAVRKIITVFLIALKNSALYPEYHCGYRKSAEKLISVINDFFNYYRYLRFYIENDRMVFRGETVWNESGKTEKFASVLFRDGVRWIEFKGGIEVEEITEFFKIFKKYKVLDDDADGDLVTALWEANLPHLRYEAEDVFWEGHAISVEELFRIRGQQKEDRKAEDSESSEKQTADAYSVSSCMSDSEIWKLSAAEIAILQQMVFREENEDKSKDVLDVLMIILEEQKSEEDFRATFEFLKREFQEVFKRAEFEALIKFLKRLHKFAAICQSEKPWAFPLFNQFFIDISGSEMTDLLKHVRPILEGLTDIRISQFRTMFRYMLPESILSLGMMLSESKSSELRRCIMEIIGFMAKKDIRPLENLMKKSDENLKKRLIYILGYLKTRDAEDLLVKTLSDPSEPVRRYALNTLLSTGYASFKVLVRCLDDPAESVRNIVSEYLGRKKDIHAESSLLDYLRNCQFQNKDHRHILQCFKVLGKCGSDNSLPFLEKILFERTWSSIFSSECSSEREAAACALTEIGTIASNTLLAKACKSPIPAIRQAYRKATKGSDE